MLPALLLRPSRDDERSLGLGHVSVIRAAGRNFDRWLDAALMKRNLVCGDTAPASP